MEVLSHGSRAQGTSLVDHEALKRERYSDDFFSRVWCCLFGRLAEQVATNAGQRNKENGGAGQSGSLTVARCGCCRHGAPSSEEPGRQSYRINLAQTQCRIGRRSSVTYINLKRAAAASAPIWDQRKFRIAASTYCLGSRDQSALERVGLRYLFVIHNAPTARPRPPAMRSVRVDALPRPRRVSFSN